MDLLRGVAILLVLVWHAPAIPALYGYDMPEWLRTANNTLLPFRMPALMFLSGLLLPRSLAKPLGPYLVGKGRNLVWPYLLWAAVHIVVHGSPAPAWHPNAWIATGYLWFLFYLIVYYALAPAVRWLPSWLLPPVLLVASVPAPEGIATRILYFGGFFFAGNLVARHPGLLERLVRRPWVVAVCTGLAVVGGVLAATGDTQYRAQYAALSLAGIVAAVAAARRFERAPGAGAVRFLGRNSVVLYTSHFPIMIGVMSLLGAVGVRHPLAIAVANLVVAVAVGTALARWRWVRPVTWLFQAPAPRRRRSAPEGAGSRPL